MKLSDPQAIVDHLLKFQAEVRSQLIAARQSRQLHEVNRTTQADTIYQIDTLVEPMLDHFCAQWGNHTPLVLVAEGVEDENGREGSKTYPAGYPEDQAEIRLIVDPIDGTRGLMYDKRSAWVLAGVASNRGPDTRLSDIEVAVMTELPTSKMGYADALWAIKRLGAHGHRTDLRTLKHAPLAIHPSSASSLAHGFGMVVNFFPATKIIAGELMQYLARELLGDSDPRNALIFDDQYISTGGQFYEMIVGHDRFNADLRPLYYQWTQQEEGLCCHPYDCATALIATEAGVVLTDACGNAFDGPMDVTTGVSWIAYANEALRRSIEPIVQAFIREKSKTGEA